MHFADNNTSKLSRGRKWATAEAVLTRQRTAKSEKVRDRGRAYLYLYLFLWGGLRPAL